MTLPRIVIIGRPNVGKSSLLNVLARQRVSIVDATPGITRDRVAVEITEEDTTFELVDTGGIGIVDRDDLEDVVETQIQVAVACADKILFVTDGKAGLTPHDHTIADRLRRLKQPVHLVVNKIDHGGLTPNMFEFTGLGMGEPLPVSALEKRGLQVLMAQIVDGLPPTEKLPDPELKIALVGKRNVGKSTFLNTLANEDRVIVSEVPGTTRDAVDVRLDIKKKHLILIDTAGLRRKKQISGSVDFYSQNRTLKAVKRSNVVFFLLDATTDISKIDKKLSSMIVEEGKPCIVIVNKWDLVEASGKNVSTKDYEKYIGDHLRGLHFAPIVFMSAKERMNINGPMRVAFSLLEQAVQRVGTGDLNRFMATLRPAPRKQHRKPKLYFATQADINPPVFVFFVNVMEAFTPAYKRYLASQLRKQFGFPEIPLKLVFRRRESRHGAK